MRKAQYRTGEASSLSTQRRQKGDLSVGTNRGLGCDTRSGSRERAPPPIPTNNHLSPTQGAPVLRAPGGTSSGHMYVWGTCSPAATPVPQRPGSEVQEGVSAEEPHCAGVGRRVGWVESGVMGCAIGVFGKEGKEESERGSLTALGPAGERAETSGKLPQSAERSLALSSALTAPPDTRRVTFAFGPLLPSAPLAIATPYTRGIAISLALSLARLCCSSAPSCSTGPRRRWEGSRRAAPSHRSSCWGSRQPAIAVWEGD